ncbi:MAG: FKBP-type peptidyl-prolyl cis-trans isomerase [Candidatus Thermoplasmatota archaeon]|jgi:FKBP-type peptidyl-prolyl cis-trans isomerase 2|nr:FKBP-type peptidyl-prolyl cis-trans isomerase [Candidatus Thermoplasmatota archaeon]MCL5963517.1 FKBP-type peptidyl-prolyl cis-trans isomerase [Candidatus Thermoplasmatota archaeon]
MNKYVIAIIIVIVFGIVAEGVVYYYVIPKQSPLPKPLSVQLNDNISVNYVGTLPNGQVFDTSILQVAVNNATYPKAVSFVFRGNTKYIPLDVHVGPSGGSSTYITTVRGFWQNLIGMNVNQSKTFIVSPSEGYGYANPQLIDRMNIYQNISSVKFYNNTDFTTIYPGIRPQAGISFTDTHWGWTDYILSANSSGVMIQFSPYVGEIVNPFGWNVKVLAIHSNGTNSTITIKNLLTPYDDNNLMGKDFRGNSFIVTNVNLQNNTFVIDYNKQIVGVNLTFTVTVLSITPYNITAG